MPTARSDYPLPLPLRRILTDRYASDDGLEESLFGSFLRPRSAPIDFAETLVATARGERGGSWELRCAVVLMLEAFLLFPAKYKCDASELWLKIQQGATVPEVPIPLTQPRRRMRRLLRVHVNFRGTETQPEALVDFLHVSSQPCKLTLGRYLFNPWEVAGRIEAAVRRSRGLPQRAALHEWERYAQLCRNRDLNGAENIVADVLTKNRQSYWVAESTPSTINAMCEYPLGTVALVIKPPGSDVEFEIKRAGVRGRHPLSAVYERNGQIVPWSHRLHGGSAGIMLDSEFRASALFGTVYESVHGKGAPISAPVDTWSVQSLPGWNGDERLLPYFTQRQSYGNGFRGMREELTRCVGAFEHDEPAQPLSGALGMTVRFLRHVAPRQALLVKTSSFRLQILEQYLADDGAEFYFRKGLHRDYTLSEARNFAHDLLEEILGVVQPCISGQSYAECLKSGFAMPRNRARADIAYKSAVQQLADYWGTLLGVGGFSYGESFVDRNVGIRSKWTAKGWKPTMCFMDHDSLVVRSEDLPNLERVVDGMRNDEWYVYGGDLSMENPVGDVLALNRIYRPEPPTRREAAAAFRKALTSAFRKTTRAMTSNLETQKCFPETYRIALAQWYRVIASWNTSRSSGESHSSWAARQKKRLLSSGCTEQRTAELIASVDYGKDFFERYSFLYSGLYSGSHRRLSLSKAQASG